MISENMPELLHKMDHLRTWKPYLIEKLEEMNTKWANELVSEIEEIRVHDSHWQEEFFWKQSYNSLVLAPRQHRLLKTSELQREKLGLRSSKNPFIGQTRPPLTIKEKALEEAANLIEKQIMHKEHPFFTILAQFQQKFSSQYLQYCCGATSIISKLSTTNIVMNGFTVNDADSFEDVSRRAIIHLREFVRILYLAIIKYYQINVVRSHNREIIIDKMTALIMKEQVYSTIYLLLLKKNQPQIQKLSCIMERLCTITLAELKISKYFQFDLQFRDTFQLKEEVEEQDQVANEPFLKSIRAIADIKKIEQPTQKLQHIYGLNKTIISEIDYFWANYKIKPKNLAIDTDNLLGVYIYVILKSKFPQILVEIEIANQFLTNIAKLSNKGFFLATLQTSLEYILSHLQDDLLKEKQEQGDNSNQGISFSKVLEKDRSISKDSRQSRPRYQSFQNEQEKKTVIKKRSASLCILKTRNIDLDLRNQMEDQVNEMSFQDRSPIELNEIGRETKISLGRKATQQLHVTIMNKIQTGGFRNSRLNTETMDGQGSFCLKEIN